MKNVLFAMMSILILGCQPKDLPTELIQSEGFASMKVSHLTTKAELESMSQKLATQEIKIDYSGSVFFDDGKIQKLKLYVVIQAPLQLMLSPCNLNILDLSIRKMAIRRLRLVNCNGI